MRYRDVCRTTLKPRKWVSDSTIMTEHCLIGDCATCNRTYVGKENRNGLTRGQDLWSNKYSLCNTVNESELAVYGGMAEA